MEEYQPLNSHIEPLQTIGLVREARLPTRRLCFQGHLPAQTIFVSIRLYHSSQSVGYFPQLWLVENHHNVSYLQFLLSPGLGPEREQCREDLCQPGIPEQSAELLHIDSSLQEFLWWFLQEPRTRGYKIGWRHNHLLEDLQATPFLT